ncbi:aconitate hydratase AcnA [Alteromonas mediterranea]|jgi:aconitate hydratase A / 2-methylisocitrate dehydratase|uniref:Aconitate hydratase n=3 Tax=Alteromonas TaxID=226 RepID=A0AAC9F6L6_9ALTE|nr:aconitate hydratase AcnA [Alteromonas mediterranea]AGF95398.1 aconitate hydratase 1 [uncultured Alteromonas sp.]AGP92185.1 aconitate hydratase 1 [Alteromonas mediterranea U8]AEA96597.1 aconitate hydratase [Alteromonas mediterranea DE]AFV83928.1 aconitate hydratase 1 [Alteromonas mediterranea DE1]AGP84204.1 aconitate hydratase 1 [Alteromonas mediterranea U4]
MTYKSFSQLEVNGKNFKAVNFDSIGNQYALDRLPFCIKILLENLIRHEDEEFVSSSDIEQVAKWDTDNHADHEVSFVPARVILQDFTGVPAIVDLAAMRDAVNRLGGDAQAINPLNPVELVIDHSVMVDHFAEENALEKNTDIEIERNKERYQFLKWGQSSFDNFKVVPPGRGIVHQVNLEYLARCAFTKEQDSETLVYPDTLVGTDSHTTMINGLGVLGWGVGGIEAEAAMLGQPVTMLLPKVVGFRLSGKLPAGVTATDMVLTITQQLREHGVVGKFVEFFGPGLKHLTTADRATIANMAPEYGATCGIFPIDDVALDYLRLTGRDEDQIALVEEYAKFSQLWHDDHSKDAQYHETLELNLDEVVPSLAGPKRPQDRIALDKAAEAFNEWHRSQIDVKVLDEETDLIAEAGLGTSDDVDEDHDSFVEFRGSKFNLEDGAIVIAAITSCTNTSNPSVLVGAGLLAKKAAEKGLTRKPWVKTSLAPGSQVVTQYLEDAGLMDPLESLGFNLVGYGCTTCIGNSGPLPDAITDAIRKAKLTVTSVLSGNRNFEGRIHPDVAANYLASPPLVVAYALAGNMNIDITKEPLGQASDGAPVYLKDIWPTEDEIQQYIAKNVTGDLFKEKYADVFKGSGEWNELEVSKTSVYDWPESTYIKHPPFFEVMEKEPEALTAIENARCLVKVGDSITTDHISPAGAIAKDSPAGEYLQAQGVSPKDFNSYGSRRGNHEVMMRGTFANVRLKNQLAPGTRGSATTHFPSGDSMSIFHAAMRYKDDGVPAVVIGGKEYGTGSSRDWAAKGPSLMGVKAVLAESYERIHRSNLIGMGILPLQFKEGESASTLALKGNESFSVGAVERGQSEVEVKAVTDDGETTAFMMDIRIDTSNEFTYFENGGILHYVIREYLKK